MESLSLRYLLAKATVVEAGFAEEICWQASIKTQIFSEPVFLRESAWVILSSGMRESVIRAKFPMICHAFHDWNSANCIWADRANCLRDAACIFRHQGKLAAILNVVEFVAKYGIETVRSEVATAGVEFLQSFPYLGPATSLHLAKNLGLDIAKPDRHLLRFAEALGFSDVQNLCKVIADEVGDSIAVVDLVLWRFATLRPDYELKKVA